MSCVRDAHRIGAALLLAAMSCNEVLGLESGTPATGGNAGEATAGTGAEAGTGATASGTGGSSTGANGGAISAGTGASSGDAGNAGAGIGGNAAGLGGNGAGHGGSNPTGGGAGSSQAGGGTGGKEATPQEVCDVLCPEGGRPAYDFGDDFCRNPRPSVARFGVGTGGEGGGSGGGGEGGAGGYDKAGCIEGCLTFEEVDVPRQCGDESMLYWECFLDLRNWECAEDGGLHTMHCSIQSLALFSCIYTFG